LVLEWILSVDILLIRRFRYDVVFENHGENVLIFSVHLRGKAKWRDVAKVFSPFPHWAFFRYCQTSLPSLSVERLRGLSTMAVTSPLVMPVLI